MATALSEETFDQERVKEKLLEFGVTNKCPMSGHNEWSLADEFVTVVPYKSKNRNFAFNKAFPAVMISCGACGYMALFSAIKLGLVEHHDEDIDD